MKIKGKLTTIFRLLILGKVTFRKKKVIDEVLVMKYIAKHTSVPTPRMIQVSDSPWGPCIFMNHIEGRLLSESLKAPKRLEKLKVLDPNIDIQTLTKAYRVMSKVSIELSKCEFTNIGGLSQEPSGAWCIGKRPTTKNMNQLVALANYPPDELPAHPFSTAKTFHDIDQESHDSSSDSTQRRS